MDAIKFNTYIGLAAATTLYGENGLVMAALVIAVLVPLVKALSVLVLITAVPNGGPRGFLATFCYPLSTNPLYYRLRCRPFYKAVHVATSIPDCKCYLGFRESRIATRSFSCRSWAKHSTWMLGQISDHLVQCSKAYCYACNYDTHLQPATCNRAICASRCPLCSLTFGQHSLCPSTSNGGPHCTHGHHYYGNKLSCCRYDASLPDISRNYYYACAIASVMPILAFYEPVITTKQIPPSAFAGNRRFVGQRNWFPPRRLRLIRGPE